MKMPLERNPFPFPQLQNDDDFVGSRSTQKSPFADNTENAQQCDPWNRLNRTPTLASARREIYHFDPQAPHDSLDFVIKSKYDHHNQFLSGNNKTLVQKETVTEAHGRILKNRKKEEPPAYDPMYPPLKIAGAQKNESPHSVEGAIQSHHSAATNRGYSRRHDGGFYSI
ncbi:protein CFAP276-like [Ciona intestinalis]